MTLAVSHTLAGKRCRSASQPPSYAPSQPCCCMPRLNKAPSHSTINSGAVPCTSGNRRPGACALSAASLLMHQASASRPGRGDAGGGVRWQQAAPTVHIRLPSCHDCAGGGCNAVATGTARGAHVVAGQNTATPCPAGIVPNRGASKLPDNANSHPQRLTGCKTRATRDSM